MIFDVNKLDILGQRDDGGVDLCIISQVPPGGKIVVVGKNNGILKYKEN